MKTAGVGSLCALQGAPHPAGCRCWGGGYQGGWLLWGSTVVAVAVAVCGGGLLLPLPFPLPLGVVSCCCRCRCCAVPLLFSLAVGAKVPFHLVRFLLGLGLLPKML